MPRLEVSNVIDILGKDCKNNKHKQCNGNWIGLGLSVECNCVCHHQQQNTSNVKREKFEEHFNISNNTMGRVVKDHFQRRAENKLMDLGNKKLRVDKSSQGSNQHESICQGED